VGEAGFEPAPRSPSEITHPERIDQVFAGFPAKGRCWISEYLQPPVGCREVSSSILRSIGLAILRPSPHQEAVLGINSACPQDLLPAGQNVAGTSRRRNAGVCCCQTSPHLRFPTHHGEQRLWLDQTLPQTNHAGLLGSSQRERHPLSGNLRLPVRRVDPVLFRYRQRALQRQGGIRPLIFTSYGSSFPFFWTPCGPSGFGFTEQLVQFVR
jgi:hypothetical protein